MHSFASTYVRSTDQPTPPPLPTVPLVEAPKGLELSASSSEESDSLTSSFSEEDADVDRDRPDDVANSGDGNRDGQN